MWYSTLMIPELSWTTKKPMWEMQYSTPTISELSSLWFGVLQLWAKEPFLQSLSKSTPSNATSRSSQSCTWWIWPLWQPLLGMIQCTTTTNKPDWKVSILVNHQRTSFKIDTGAQCNVISKSRYHQLSSMPLQQSGARLVAFGGEHFNACGRVTMKCEYKGHAYTVSFEVINQDVPNILGLQTCVDMNLVQRLDAIDNHDSDL